MNFKFPTVSKKATVSGINDNVQTIIYENGFGCCSREKLKMQNDFTISALSSGEGE